MADQYLPFAWDETQFQGKTYALPFDTDVRALFYNKDLIEAAGQDASALDIANGPPDDRRGQCDRRHDHPDGRRRQLHADGLDPRRTAPQGSRGPSTRVGTTRGASPYGGSFADLEACQVTPTDPGVVAGYQFLYDWAAERDPAKVSRFVATNMPDPARPRSAERLHHGQARRWSSPGRWRINQMAQLAPDTNYGFTYIPVPNEGDESATWAGGWSAALIPDSDVPDEAWRFIQYLAGPEGQTIYTEETTHLPTLNALLEDESLFDEQLAQFLPLLRSRTTGRRWRWAPSTGMP